MLPNKIFYIIITFVFLIINTIRCKKALEEKPKATVSLGELDPVLLEQTVIGVYEPLTRSRGRLWESTIGLGLELMSEYADGGPTQVSWSNYNTIMTSPNGVASSWTTLYEAIGRANLLIANLDQNTTLSADLKNRAYGECYFVRGLCYYFAVRVWGKVPLRLQPILSSNDVGLAVSEIAAIYDQVLKDLKFAEGVLPLIVSGAQAVRATQAAKVALADVCLTRGDFQNARDKAKEVMDKKASFGYDLETSLETVYSPKLPTNREDVFSLKFSQVLNQGAFMASYWADSRAKASGYSVSGNKFGGIVSAAPLIKGWDNNDLRKKFSLYNTTS